MGVFFDEPDYPVIDKAPQFWKTGDPACAACKSSADQGFSLWLLLQLATSTGRTGQRLQGQLLLAIPSAGQLVSFALLLSMLVRLYMPFTRFATHRCWSESTETVSYHGSHDWRIRWFYASVSAVIR